MVRSGDGVEVVVGFLAAQVAAAGAFGDPAVGAVGLLLPLFAEDVAGVVLVPLPFLPAGLVPRGREQGEAANGAQRLEKAVVDLELPGVGVQVSEPDPVGVGQTD